MDNVSRRYSARRILFPLNILFTQVWQTDETRTSVATKWWQPFFRRILSIFELVMFKSVFLSVMAFEITGLSCRMTPMMMVTIAFCATLLPYFGDGPMWTEVTSQYTQNCKANWWTNALYIHNFVHTDKRVNFTSMCFSILKFIIKALIGARMMTFRVCNPVKPQAINRPHYLCTRT